MNERFFKFAWHPKFKGNVTSLNICGYIQDLKKNLCAFNLTDVILTADTDWRNDVYRGSGFDRQSPPETQACEPFALV
jgi:hypothetical protein